MDTKILEQAGFTKGEIRVYLALLELSETTTGNIIKNLKLQGLKYMKYLRNL